MAPDEWLSMAREAGADVPDEAVERPGVSGGATGRPGLGRDRARVSRRARDRAGHPDPAGRRLPAGRGRGAGRVRGRGHGLAARRRPGQSGGVDHHRRAAAGDRSPAPEPVGGRSRRAAGRADAPGRPARGAIHGRREHDRRRPAAADLHLLPPGAGDARARGAHAARARGPDDRRDRPRVPGRRADHGQADRAREAQDRRRAHPLPGAGRRGAARPPARRAAGRVPDLQRGLRGRRGRSARPRGAVRRGDPPRRAAVPG